MLYKRRPLQFFRKIKPMKLSRLFPVIYSQHLSRSKEFYSELLGFDIEFDSDWFINLVGGVDGQFELGIQQFDHELIPEKFRARAQGLSIALEVENVDEIYEKFRNRKDLVSEIADEEYGQRHFMCVDPNGVLLDVCTPIEPSEAFKAEHME